MTIELGFGKTKLKLNINQENLLGVLQPNQVKVELTGREEVIRALRQPINSPRLSEIVKPGEKVVFITSDITRPVPNQIILPLLLEELWQAGIKKEDVKIVFALGSHRFHSEEEKKSLVGEAVYRQVECLDSDQRDCIRLGFTRLGTPVDIFRPVVEADRRICVGNIEYHYFAGYSGGAKAIMPGVSTREAIQANHSRMVEAEAHAGNITTNRVRQDIDEVAEFVPIDFIVNVVLNEQKQIIKAVAGHYLDAHREGCKFLDSLYKVKIKEQADIVIVSAGGFPKDINLYQAQKALDNAKHAVKKNGVIILVASCKEGLGEEIFQEWMLSASRPEDLILRIKEKFQLGGHKAAAIAMVLQHADIYLVSDLEPDSVKRIFMQPFNSLEAALDQAFQAKGDAAKVLVIPYGGSTLPYLEL
ncbi:Nickel-dependent lactate racemase [Carboxydocella thermautotrophica]|nr:Nickel-dependent lactate racemase [Carboxydocella thermautotrophica]